MRKAFLLALLFPVMVVAQEPKRTDVFSPFKFFIVSWKGTGQGQSGDSQVQRQYQYILNGKFIQINHKSIYAPQAKTKKVKLTMT
jgi:hypothetical protein